jgi:hypothetical protein
MQKSEMTRAGLSEKRAKGSKRERLFSLVFKAPLAEVIIKRPREYRFFGRSLLVTYVRAMKPRMALRVGSLYRSDHCVKPDHTSAKEGLSLADALAMNPPLF